MRSIRRETAATERPRRSRRWRWLAVVFALVASTMVLAGVFYYLPVPGERRDFVALPIPWPTNSTGPSCAYLGVGDSGRSARFFFTLEDLNGNVALLRLLGPTGAQLWQGIGDTPFSGQITVEENGGTYASCLSTPAIEPTPVASVTLYGNLTSAVWSPLL